LSPARHLRVNQATLENEDDSPTPTGASWLDARPVFVSPQLRKTGRQPSAAPSRRIVDRSRDLAALRARLEARSRRDEEARRSLIALGPRRLSEVGHLRHEALMMLVELLDRAAAVRRSGADPITATSDDGSLQIQIHWNVPRGSATIATPLGHLHMHDAWICIEGKTP
jgi:hypothetical protein